MNLIDATAENCHGLKRVVVSCFEERGESFDNW